MDAFTVSLGVNTLTGTAAMAMGIRAWRISQRENYYARLKRRLRQFRMSKLLTYLGADVDAYVHAVPINELSAEMRRCSRCAAVATCDACLRDGKVLMDMNFCPVYRSVTRHSRIFINQS